MPDESICNHANLSKMILDHSSLRSPANEKYFDRGMRLKRLRLDVVDSDSIDNQLKTVNFPGVETIEIDMYDNLVSFSWLSRFSSKHPTLNELWLLEIEDSDLFTHDESPFLALAQEYQPPQGLHVPFTILEVGLHRAKPLGKSSQEWHVVELTLEINGRLFEQLSLLAFSFPKLEILTLDSDSAVYYLDSAVYDISDLSSVLARFSSLKVVSLEHFAARLSFGPENEKLSIPPMPRVAHTHRESSTNAEHKLRAFVTCLAKQVRALESVHITDIGYADDAVKLIGRRCRLEGWLHVFDSNRAIGGTLRVSF
ncbi:hypothetical protein EV361DRAFT_953378 [Lentinula raphanica]|nr:hypothetical protein EV361DRAFT_953378 [Lentinula raphanica]